MNRFLVTGAEGQLGAEICRQLGPVAIGLDLPNFDLTDRARVHQTVGRVSPEVVINTAAYTRVDQAEGEPDRCRAINATGVAHLVEACRKVNAVLVQISTDYVFGGHPSRSAPYRETDQPAPQNVYGRAKLAGEEEARRLQRHFVVRTSGLFGLPGSRSAGNFVESMLRLSEQRPELSVVGDQQCTPTYARHLARAILFLLTTGAFGTYHVVNSGETTWYEFATEIFRLADCQVQLQMISSAEYGAPAQRPSYSVLDTAKYHALPGRPELPPWRDALREYLEHRQTASAGE